jgi:hypothetical protein
MKENELLFFTPEVEATNMKRKLSIKPGGLIGIESSTISDTQKG